jgi:hypothetical protein
MLYCRVADPLRIHFIRIRIQHFRLNADLDLDPIRIRIHGINDKKFKKYYSWKKITFFLSKTTIYLSLGVHKEQKRPSALKREH